MWNKRLFYILLFLQLYTLNSCRKSESANYYEIINKYFLKIVDTTAYKYGLLIPAPNDSFLNTKNRKLIIFVQSDFKEPSSFEKDVKNIIKMEAMTEFDDFSFYSSINKLKVDVPKIINTGRYSLSTDSAYANNQSLIVGSVAFFNPYISGDRAIFLVSIFSGLKSGRTMVFFFKKERKTWNIVKSDIIEQW